MNLPSSPALRWTAAIGALAAIGGTIWLLLISRWFLVVLLGLALVVVSVIALFKNVEARKFKVVAGASNKAQTSDASTHQKAKARLSTDGQPAVFLFTGVAIIVIGLISVNNDLKPTPSTPASRSFPDAPAPASVPRPLLHLASQIEPVTSATTTDSAPSSSTAMLPATSPWRSDSDQPINVTAESCRRVAELENRVSCRLLLVNDSAFAYGLDSDHCHAVDDLGNSYDSDNVHSVVSWEESGKPVPVTSYPLAPGTEHAIQVVLAQPLNGSATVLQLRMSLKYPGISFFIPVWVDVAVSGVT